MPVPIVAPVVVGAGLALVAGKAAERNAPSSTRVGAWGPSRGLVLADVARARATGPTLLATVGKCKAWGYARGRADATAGKPSDPSGAVASSDVARDVSDPTFRAQCMAAIVNGYLEGYRAARPMESVTSLSSATPTWSRCAPPAGPGPDADAFQFGWSRAFNYVAGRTPSSPSAEAAAAASDLDRDGPGRGWTPARIAALKSEIRRGYACGLANARGNMPAGGTPKVVRAQNAGLETPAWRRW